MTQLEIIKRQSALLNQLMHTLRIQAQLLEQQKNLTEIKHRETLILRKIVHADLKPAIRGWLARILKA